MEYYPFLFKPLIKERIWGGQKLGSLLGKPQTKGPAGESWELSGVAGSISELQNGPLAGMLLTELIERDPKAVLGSEVIRRFGHEFPILIKFIDARTDLSIQVHPDDTLAQKRHGSKGKTEMWYIMDADPGARLVLGFKEPISTSDFTSHLEDKNLIEIIHEQPIRPGEAYFIQARTVHAIGGGILLAEIQQTSDITYRIYDYDRVGTDGKQRELHTELALDAMDLAPAASAYVNFNREANQLNPVVQSPYFTTQFLPVSGSITRDFSERDAFTIFMCVQGKVELKADHHSLSLSKGMTSLIPAIIEELQIEGEAELLEITL